MVKDSSYYLSPEAYEELYRLSKLRRVDGVTGYLNYLANVEPTLISNRPQELTSLDAERNSNDRNPLWEWEQGGKFPRHLKLPNKTLAYLERVAQQFGVKASYRRTNYNIPRVVIEAIGLGFIKEQS